MIKRPKISFNITGQYNEIRDKRALRMEKLISLVLKKSGIENRSEHKSAMTADILEDIYEEMRDDDRLEKIEDDLDEKYDGKEFDREYRKALIKEVSKIQVVSELELQTLASSRVKRVVEYLTQEKNIDLKRLIISDVAVDEDSEAKLVKMKFDIEIK